MFVDLQYVDSKIEVSMWFLIHMGGKVGGRRISTHLT